MTFDPAVEADFADGAGTCFESRKEGLLPIGGGVRDLPWVQTNRGEEAGVGSALLQNERPVMGTGADHYSLAEIDAVVSLLNFILMRTKPGVCQMDMRIVEAGSHFRGEIQEAARQERAKC